jgi:hypothetical protein
MTGPNGPAGGAVPPAATQVDAGRGVNRQGCDLFATRLDPGRQPRHGPQRAATGLPQILAERFREIRVLPGGVQARLSLVHDEDGRERVLKLYHHDGGADPRVAPVLPRLHGLSRSVAEVVEVGEAGGRRYEVMEHLAGGSVRELAPAVGGIDSAVLTTVVEQVAQALATMHAAAVVHRDIKPDNVMVRSLDSLEIAVVDFGIARRLDYPYDRADRSGTPIYSAPETFATASGDGHVGRPSDWWSLGMTVVELATGRHPYHHLADLSAEELVQALAGTYLAGRAVDLSGVADLDLRTLCGGLLRADHHDRWGTEEVRRWLAGEPVAVIPGYEARPEEPPETGIAGFSWGGLLCTDRYTLQQALLVEWDRAAAYFFAPLGEPWETLVEWLRQFPDAGSSAAVRRERMIAQVQENGNDTPDLKLLWLTRWLDPEAPVVYRGQALSTEYLPVFAGRAVSVAETPDAVQTAVVEDLKEHRLLDQIDDATGHLADIDARWRSAEQRWADCLEGFGARRPGLAAAAAGRRALARAYLLWLAAAPNQARAALLDRIQESRRSAPDTFPAWYDRRATRAASSADLLLCVVLGEEAEAAARVREQQWRNRQRQLMNENRDEWFRQQERPIALGWAVVAVGLIAVGWAWVIALSDVLPVASVQAVSVAWVCAIMALAVVAAAELWLAATIGGPYHPQYSLLRLAVRRGARVAAPVSQNGMLGLALILGTLAVLVAATTYAPYALPVAATVTHLGWTLRRSNRWRDHRADRAEQMETAREEQRTRRIAADQDDPPLEGDPQ